MTAAEAIKCPYCPNCGAEPVMAWLAIVPWFCPNDDCNVFGWDPYSTARQNLEDATEVQFTIDKPHGPAPTPPAP